MNRGALVYNFSQLKNDFTKTGLSASLSLLQAEYVILNYLCVLGVEPVLLGPFDLCGPCPLGVGASFGVSSSSSWWFEGLPEAEGAALHSQHRGHPHLPGRVYTRYQTTWRAHGPQPAGTCNNRTDTPIDSYAF